MSILDCFFFTGIEDAKEDTDASEHIDVLDNVEESGDGDGIRSKSNSSSVSVCS